MKLFKSRNYKLNKNEFQDPNRFSRKNRFTQKSVHKKDFFLNKDSQYSKDIQELVLEFLSISENVRVDIYGRSTIIFFVQLFTMNKEILKYLRNAPLNIQKQYLISLYSTHSIHSLELFMKTAESMNYDSILFDLDSTDREIITSGGFSCIISTSSFDDRDTSTEVAKLRGFADQYSRTILNHNFSSPEILKSIRSRWVRLSEYGNAISPRRVDPALTSTMLMLCEKYSSKIIGEIIEGFKEIYRKPTIDEIISLAADWSNLKEYPIDWGLEVANQSSLNNSDAHLSV